MKKPSLILALDFDTDTAVWHLIDKINPADCAIKVGSVLFTRFGPSLIQQLVAKHFRVFLDLKFHDIPNTVAEASKAAADLGVWMFNVHALGGEKMMLAAKAAIESYGKTRPLLIAVTVLTSHDEASWQALGFKDGLSAQVIHFSKLAQHCGLDGVVCSGLEVSRIKAACGVSFLTVTPGIRFSQTATHDQVRTMTPLEAVQAGSDYLVIGRAVTEASDPQAVLAQLMKS